MDETALARILAYHERTKHHFHRYAPGPGYLDWATQPDPFRHYAGAPGLALTRREPQPDEPPWYDDLFGRLPPAAVNADTLSVLLFHSFALSAWKAVSGSRWSLRCNPSSGNLHPTEVYLLTGPIPGLTVNPGLYHYNPWFHGLEVRAEPVVAPDSEWSQSLPANALVFGFTSIHWRESWKYGERALRYCLLDLGHAFAALGFSAAALGWSCVLLPFVERKRLARLLGVAGQQGPEAEHPDCLAAVFPAGSVDWPSVCRWRPSDSVIAAIESALRDDPPNRLSPAHRPWPIIERTVQALDRESIVTIPAPEPSPAAGSPRPVGARWLFRHRRSVQAMDGRTVMAQADFLRLLRRLLPGNLPVAELGCEAGVHLGFFIHRVGGLVPGLYFLARSRSGLDLFRYSSRGDWEWLVPFPGLPFYRLQSGDARQIAKALSCHQGIASDGAFAVAMLAEFEPRLRRSVWEYARLHMEAGALGQLLYLEAEAAGLRGTGIGCFFDDPVHELFALKNRDLQVIYHFTVGGGLEDKRLTALDAYHHLRPADSRAGA